MQKKGMRPASEVSTVKGVHYTGFPFILFKFILQLQAVLPLGGFAVSYTANSLSTPKGRPKP